MAHRTAGLHHKLARHGHQIAEEILAEGGVPKRRVRRCVKSIGIQVCIEVSPANAIAHLTREFPGMFLSPTERLIWNVLSETEHLLGKEVAAQIGQEYEAKLRHILSNLEDRRVIRHESGKGYLRAKVGENAE